MDDYPIAPRNKETFELVWGIHQLTDTDEEDLLWCGEVDEIVPVFEITVAGLHGREMWNMPDPRVGRTPYWSREDVSIKVHNPGTPFTLYEVVHQDVSGTPHYLRHGQPLTLRDATRKTMACAPEITVEQMCLRTGVSTRDHGAFANIVMRTEGAGITWVA